MENNSPLLSICIPTYNRSEYLGNSLKALFEQASVFPGKLEIVISDNASTDNTEEVVKSYQEKWSNLFYSKNSDNLGYDRNLDNVIRNAHGEYCWFMSDDEIVQEGTIAYILNLISENKDIAYFCVNIMTNKPRNFPDKETVILNNGSELIKTYGLVGGLISQNIIRKELYPENTSQYFGNLWLHLSIIYDIIADKKIMLVNKDLVQGQRDECTWAKGGKAFITFTNLKVIIESLSAKGYDSGVINAMLKEHVHSLPKTVLSAFLNGLPNTPEHRDLLKKEYSTYGLPYILSECIFMMPNFLFTFARKILGK